MISIIAYPSNIDLLANKPKFLMKDRMKYDRKCHSYFIIYLFSNRNDTIFSFFLHFSDKTIIMRPRLFIVLCLSWVLLHEISKMHVQIVTLSYFIRPQPQRLGAYRFGVSVRLSVRPSSILFQAVSL